MITLTALDLATLEDARDWRAEKLLKAHHALHDHVCDRQDDGCALSEADAVKMLRLMRKFAILKESADEYVAISRMPARIGRDDCLVAYLMKTPNAAGLYETCSTSDRFDGMFDLQTDTIVPIDVAIARQA